MVFKFGGQPGVTSLFHSVLGYVVRLCLKNQNKTKTLKDVGISYTAKWKLVCVGRGRIRSH